MRSFIVCHTGEGVNSLEGRVALHAELLAQGLARSSAVHVRDQLHGVTGKLVHEFVPGAKFKNTCSNRPPSAEGKNAKWLTVSNAVKLRGASHVKHAFILKAFPIFAQCFSRFSFSTKRTRPVPSSCSGLTKAPRI